MRCDQKEQRRFFINTSILDDQSLVILGRSAIPSCTSVHFSVLHALLFSSPYLFACLFLSLPVAPLFSPSCLPLLFSPVLSSSILAFYGISFSSLRVHYCPAWASFLEVQLYPVERFTFCVFYMLDFSMFDCCNVAQESLSDVRLSLIHSHQFNKRMNVSLLHDTLVCSKSSLWVDLSCMFFDHLLVSKTFYVELLSKEAFAIPCGWLHELMFLKHVTELLVKICTSSVNCHLLCLARLFVKIPTKCKCKWCFHPTEKRTKSMLNNFFCEQHHAIKLGAEEEWTTSCRKNGINTVPPKTTDNVWCTFRCLLGSPYLHRFRKILVYLLVTNENPVSIK
ncbi:hypothetical protein EGR_01766 [Echinococcus granulosus]|uniref:Uncharacterized protein n=1 Tax=Echinococcus granulosus TaxID=6210 RepID=W6UNN9_ECHGR|nr:hypothetical protein EGR_01766 [Echinococcus granulosus]EUB63275.1 hypothetical protein EGR_01766 [Echinococcus granulosus]